MEIIGLIIFVLDVVAIISILTGHGSAGHKVLWVILILVLPLLSLILYYLLGRKSADA